MGRRKHIQHISSSLYIYAVKNGLCDSNLLLDFDHRVNYSSSYPSSLITCTTEHLFQNFPGGIP